jgi:hypothetical protein
MHANILFQQKSRNIHDFRGPYQFLLLRVHKRAEVDRANEHGAHEAETDVTAATTCKRGAASALALE